MSLAHDNSRTVGRKKHWSEDMQARFNKFCIVLLNTQSEEVRMK
jgi:hypothetical protein